MTSAERHEARYQRRKAARYARLMARNEQVGDLATVFRHSAMFKIGKICCNGTRWKKGTQVFERHLFSMTSVRRKQVLQGTWKPKPFHRFYLTHRGKLRLIDAPRIEDRQIHKVFNRRVLIPLLGPSVVPQQGASLPGTGYQKMQHRLENDLRSYFREYGPDCLHTGGIFFFDFKGFFENANKRLMLDRHYKYIRDYRVRYAGDVIITSDPYPGNGMPIGVEPAQTEMVSLPSTIDHMMVCQLGLERYGRYMDDSRVIAPIDQLKSIRELVFRLSEELEIPISPHKCSIQPLSRPFHYCKARYKLTKTGAVKTKGCKTMGRRSTHKLKALIALYDAGLRDRLTIDCFYQSMLAYFSQFDDHKRKLAVMQIYYDYFTLGKKVWYHEPEDVRVTRGC